ncbi:hypothetical protein EAI30_13520 [Romboutsia ilealis]|uniref:Uncharacterized protein n=1 Tax=Romboutsia faecis TaxID=2764597 RepID=A0ABR7JT48_9FIRM|nr:hypothetical protein [Romboutsia faecis]MBC5997942.1 hypothetical protein [Romboutsia faecis]MRN25637.1 hypothetical protein [Romboutsia ilealis]
MKSFNLKSGTIVNIDDTKINILRTDGKSALKGLFAGRTMGEMTIKLSAVTGVIQYADYLLICASGLPTPNDFKISSIPDIKQYPNCIVGKENELKEIYDHINTLL